MKDHKDDKDNKKGKGKGKDNAPGQNKEFTIYVNATPETWTGKNISFSEVTRLAFEKPPYGKYT